MRAKALVVAALFLMAAVPAHAKNWQIDYAHSKLGFIGDQNGEKFSGRFRKFDAHISFDPDHLDESKISVTVDTASATTGDDEWDSYLPQDSWFDVAVFPAARFVATKFHQTAKNAYEAEGSLTIKGVTRDLTLPFTLTQEGDHWRAHGHIALMRNDFSIGSGSFADPAYVKNAVEVVVDLAARPMP